MKHLQQKFPVGVNFTHRLCMSIILASSLLFTNCKKDLKQYLNEITVHKGCSIQAAVDLAVSGMTIKIEPGTYYEAVVINTPHLTLIGLGNAKTGGVIIQNPSDEENGITVKGNGDGFKLKNVTVKDFKENGVYLNGVNGFELSHVTTINNGEYGLFPVHSKNGKIEDCTASGHTDTGIYVGQSSDVAIKNCEAYDNVNGIEIENCTRVSADKNNTYNNVAGILVILLPGLDVKASSDVTLTKNNIQNNNKINVPHGGGFEDVVPSGSGILLVGVDNAIIKDNTIKDNNFVGIATVSTLVLGSLAGLPPEAFADIEPNADGAKITKNKLVNNGTVTPVGLPLPAVDILWDGSGNNNCWKDNVFTTSYPATLPACL